ncbi:hypothetical protein PUNSTDRAFT_115380 [Punctularia strigosozonata HHB-11173 SS5]|uniref:uncharacterized protein n=1 Tax=Punctularia strigosozonata (strain HHB-11173) TaxID=741275 RepID=UPI0004417DCA|nr:uncharacterized protein PUNSTDRAFT_115380 [Punctularia strigosozonata HHB-11173 SS5]EIN05987.1 hypothetical protein PUNSTDRAFT_115380 [Punctularia strigosozonata HHB-11173 SS5]
MAMLNTSDARINTAYKAVLNGKAGDWLLLSYGESPNSAALYSSGAAGLYELKDNIHEDYVFFGFYREEIDGDTYYVLITYAPESLKGKARASTIMHSRCVGTVFSVPKAVITVSRKDEIESHAVMRAIREQLIARRSSSTKLHSAPKTFLGRRSRRAVSDNTQRKQSHSPGSSSIGSLLSPSSSDDDAPPPPPPKDDKFTSPTRLRAPSPPGPVTMVVPAPSSPPDAKPSVHAWKSLVPRPRPDPVERARLRAEARLRQEEEERVALEEERLRQERHRLEKLALERQYELEEHDRKQRIDEEVRRAAAERRRKEALQRQEEEERLRLLRDKRQAEKERRLEETRRIEKWRAERAKQLQEREKARASARASAELERKSRLLSADQSATEGWVTVQVEPLMVWRRRFFKIRLQDGDMLLYRTKLESEKSGAKPVDVIKIRDVKRLMEWSEDDREGDNERLQELEAIPNSFALDFGQAERSLSMLFADTAAEKDTIMALVARAAGL